MTAARSSRQPETELAMSVHHSQQREPNGCPWALVSHATFVLTSCTPAEEPKCHTFLLSYDILSQPLASISFDTADSFVAAISNTLLLTGAQPVFWRWAKRALKTSLHLNMQYKLNMVVTDWLRRKPCCNIFVKVSYPIIKIKTSPSDFTVIIYVKYHYSLGLSDRATPANRFKRCAFRKINRNFISAN